MIDWLFHNDSRSLWWWILPPIILFAIVLAAIIIFSVSPTSPSLYTFN